MGNVDEGGTQVQYLEVGATLNLSGVDFTVHKTSPISLQDSSGNWYLLLPYDNSPDYHLLVSSVGGNQWPVLNMDAKVYEALVLGSIVQDLTGKKVI